MAPAAAPQPAPSAPVEAAAAPIAPAAIAPGPVPSAPVAPAALRVSAPSPFTQAAAAPPPAAARTQEPPTLVTPAITAPAAGGQIRSTVPGTPGRIINPFLAQDPQVKARRLARALISDMISYHPAKRAQGLKDGTLKDIFREEIKKSYEEYVLQVGDEVAKSTSHFQEALNEILAGGQRIF
jgi:hypothetical protein